MRFDDSLRTVLSADMTPGLGARSAWRQLVDLMGRGRIAADPPTLARLRMLRAEVPVEVRAASARALAFAAPDAALVAMFADDELRVAAPLLRTVVLAADDWLALLGRLSPPMRAILRSRRDLPAAVVRGLESFGSVDFTLVDHRQPANDTDPAPADPDGPPPALPPHAPLSPSSFVALGEVTRGLPLVAEALRRASEAPTDDTFAIADIVARIDAFQRERPEQAPATERDATPTGFRFLTDASGMIRWVDGVGRAGLVGITLALAGRQAMVHVDAGIASAVRRRARFAGLRLEIDGLSDAAGSWRIAGIPDFDRATGRFTGFAGTARRPLRHESAAPPQPVRSPASESLRQLVHELRTPATAVAGFAELIETQLLGPVPATYRDRAALIGRQAGDLLVAIDDLDTAARIEGGALDLRDETVALKPLVERLAADLAPLAAMRHAELALDIDDVAVAADMPAVERVVARLLATLVAAAASGERIGLTARIAGDGVTMRLDRPRALGELTGDALFSLDDGVATEDDGAPLLGAGFTLRLVRNLAVELGGSLAIEPACLTLRLPAVQDRGMGQASSK